MSLFNKSKTIINFLIFPYFEISSPVYIFLYFYKNIHTNEFYLILIITGNSFGGDAFHTWFLMQNMDITVQELRPLMLAHAN